MTITNACIVHVKAVPKALPVKLYTSCTFEGMGMVASAMAREETRSQKLMKNMMRWYAFSNLLWLRKMKFITNSDAQEERDALLMVVTSALSEEATGILTE